MEPQHHWVGLGIWSKLRVNSQVRGDPCCEHVQFYVAHLLALELEVSISRHIHVTSAYQRTPVLICFNGVISSFPIF